MSRRRDSLSCDRRQFLAALGSAAAGFAALSAHALQSGASSVAEVANDPDRPEYHLLPPHNWMNDPNGPIWWKGKYHLFYQLNPNAAVWGDMHWGHAVSADMVHWRHEPIALAPTPGGPDSEGCFSGSAVVRDGVPTFLYTGVQNAPPDQVTLHDASGKLRETQMLATAEDDGLLHWKKLAAPVIASPPSGMQVTGFRDPCAWREGDEWYLVVGSGERGKGGFALLYRSSDLRAWEYLHPLAEGKPTGGSGGDPVDTGEMWECPDFFELNGKHCLLYSTERKVYWTTGEYDASNHRYTPTRTGVLDHGAYYAPKSFVAHDGRRVLWGWIPERRPEAEYARAGWAGAMSLPRVLTIGAEGQLQMHPAAEVEKLRGPAQKMTLKPEAPLRQALASLRLELHARIWLLRPEVLTVRLTTADKRMWELTVDVKGNTVRCGDTSFPLPGLPWPRPDLSLFLDGSVIEAFIGGREAITSRVYGLKPNETQLEVTLAGDRPVEIELWPLAAISSDRLTT
jgi:beta-fructofuranosidase